MPLDHTNMMILNFMKETYDKANEKCTLWFIKNQANLEKVAKLPEKFKGRQTEEGIKLPIEMSISSFASQLPSAAVHRRKKPLRDGVVQGKSQMAQKGMWKELEPEPTMTPVSSDIKDILYEPLPYGGRREYLARRNRVTPEKRYNFCMTSNAEFGWRMRDSHQARQLPTYGRYFVFEHDLRSRSGPHPDPANYQKPPEIPYSKCPH